MNIELERQAFEAHMRLGGYSNPEKHPDGSYVSSAMELWWQGWNAYAAWQRTRPAQTEQRPSATQQILDLILEQCRYWHGRDEARRGGFACLYAAAKEVADNAAPVSQPAQTELVEALERARSNFRITLKQLNDVPEAAWNGRLDRAHQYTTQGLQQVEQALSTYRAALAAQGGE